MHKRIIAYSAFFSILLLFTSSLFKPVLEPKDFLAAFGLGILAGLFTAYGNRIKPTMWDTNLEWWDKEKG